MSMNSLDVLYYSLAVSAIALTTGLLYLLYQVAKTVKEMQQVIEDVNSVTHDLEAMKESLKSGVLGKFAILAKFFEKKKSLE